MKPFILLAAIVLSAFGCTDADRSQWGALGAKHRVELYSGGQMVREWTSTGAVSNEYQSDGYYFVDSESGELVRVSGDLVITQLE